MGSRVSIINCQISGIPWIKIEGQGTAYTRLLVEKERESLAHQQNFDCALATKFSLSLPLSLLAKGGGGGSKDKARFFFLILFWVS